MFETDVFDVKFILGLYGELYRKYLLFYYSLLVRDLWQISNLDNSANRWVLHRLKLKIWKLRALIDNQRIYYVPDIRVIYTSLFITTMTSRKKVPVSSFGHVTIYAWPWCICPPTFAQIALSNSELFTFSEIQDGNGRRLGLREMSITPNWIELFAQNLVGRCITAMRR